MPNPTSPKPTKGPIHAVPCPHCGTMNDLRSLAEQIGASFENGALPDCDKCGMVSVVVGITQVTFVALVQDPQGRRREVGPAPAAPQGQRRMQAQQQRGALPRAKVVRRGLLGGR